VSRLGDQMHLYPPEHTIAGPYLIDQFDPELIDSLLNLLDPSNMRSFPPPPDVMILRRPFG
jgi:secreted Zn-dependent insulinase-like peptidase